MPVFKVKYQAGTYSGTRTVTAEDGEEAKNKVKAEIRRNMTLPMYSDSYKVISESDEDDNDNDD